MKRMSPSSVKILNKIKMKRKTGEKIKKTLTSVMSYLRSDSYMYSSLLSNKYPDCFSYWISSANNNILSTSKGMYQFFFGGWGGGGERMIGYNFILHKINICRLCGCRMDWNKKKCQDEKRISAKDFRLLEI